ncbi:hypothetical protein LFL96_13190 [Paraburkholderia sp. D15]|uniref:hypothetical protein n=1 Tax=Paraburkholderia sp. D15 TaxID=2880218 RepID=UPI00247B28FB|nr:hypothetical protein [Paraburkholderia sp. D15]WGS48735.1 hypothetical protein LFL96_13190 [Paraburkholderia sp. D15]WKF56618.1 hypothetical protein HUO10_001077 [Paraburkholderia busanensis]
MKSLSASTRSLALTAFVALAATFSGAALAQASSAGGTPKLQCAIGYVTGVGGAALSFHEYLATPERDRYRYIADNPINCKVSDEGRASGCTGVTNLRNEEVSVYDDVDDTTMAVVARVELDHGTYPVIIQVRRQDVRCER